MDQTLRNKLRNVVTQCRRLLEDAVSQVLQGQFGIFATGKKDEVQVEDAARMGHLTPEDCQYREQILVHLDHIQAGGFKPHEKPGKPALDQMIREVAFTHLNRLCAYRMMECRGLIREAVSRGLKSQGFLFYLADHEADEKLHNSGQQDVAYRHFLNWLGGTLSEEIGVLFSPNDPANRLFPPQRVLDEVLGLLNSKELKDIWTEDEAIGWVYQYFTPKELRDQARKESAAPRNSYELAFRNQFFTPRYVVEFLTDNTLGRIWYEMTRGKTRLKDQCRYMVSRPNEVFLSDPIREARHLGISISKTEDIPATVQAAYRGDFANVLGGTDGTARSWVGLAVPLDQYAAATGHPYRQNEDHPTVKEVWNAIHEHPEDIVRLHPLKILVALSQLVRTASGGPYAAQAEDQLWSALIEAANGQAEQGDLSQEELLKQPVCIPHRAKKDPREIKVLDPACGSGHFLLYCFDLLLVIYEEAYADPDLGPPLKKDYPTLEALRQAVPGLVLSRNLHGIDIDLRATQIAALALWLRAQRAYQDMGIKKDRPKIIRSNIVCSEPMPGEDDLLQEFLGELQPKVLGQLVRVVFEKMKLAGEAGSLLKIDEELQDIVAEAKRQWIAEREHGTDRKGQALLFSRAEMQRVARKEPQGELFDVLEITDEQFWHEAEDKVVAALQEYAAYASNGNRLQRQLFVEDAVRGFGFVDLCRQRYHVALMNPPFGLLTPFALEYAKQAYPTASNDCFASFVDRALSLLEPAGLVGVISSRLGFFLDGLEDWRKRLYGEVGSIQHVADLGYGVLDAVVETAAYTIQRLSTPTQIAALSVLDTQAKDERLLDAITDLRFGRKPRSFHSLPSAIFSQLPGAVLAYWLPQDFAQRVISLPKMSEYGVCVYSGLQTDDHFRFLRLWWEAPIHADARWRGFAKGGEYLPYADDFHLVINWGDDGSELKAFVATKYQHWSRHIKNTDKYGISGLTYTERTTSDLSVRAMPKGMIFSVSGPAIISENGSSLNAAWAVLSSRIGKALIEMGVGSGDTSLSGTAARHYRIRVVGACPFPTLSKEQEGVLADCVDSLYRTNLESLVQDESHRLFRPPLEWLEGTISGIGTRFWERTVAAFRRASQVSAELDRTVAKAFSLEDESQLIALAGPHPAMQPAQEHDDRQHGQLAELLSLNESDLCDHAIRQNVHTRAATKKTYYFSRRLELVTLVMGVNPDVVAERAVRMDEGWTQELPKIACDILSLCVGCGYGRWDVRFATGNRQPPELPDPFDPLPVCSPGMLTGNDGLPAKEAPPDYLLRIDSDGIMVDDSDHSKDILRRVREVLELIWKDRADAIEKEACDLLGVKELREYFRKPGSGGFWDDHVKRYSKSRRKAPIYWLLQSSKKNYAIWLYYHRLDKDILFKALETHVRPKVRLEDDRLKTLRTQRTGATGRDAKQLDKQIVSRDTNLYEVTGHEPLRVRPSASEHPRPLPHLP